MSLTAEQILASHKANIETLFGLTTKAFEGVEKLVELNVTASRAALSEAAQHTQAVLGVKDAQELLALQAGLFQPLAEKTAAYSRHLYDIASGTGAEFGKALESQTTDAQKAFTTLVDSAAKNAPAGSETAVAVMKSAVAAANNAFESVQKAVKQASDVAEANFNAVASTAVNADQGPHQGQAARPASIARRLAARSRRSSRPPAPAGPPDRPLSAPSALMLLAMMAKVCSTICRLNRPMGCPPAHSRCPRR
jgi:phasin family protein